MKTLISSSRQISFLAFVLLAAVFVAGFSTAVAVNVAGLVGGLAVMGLLAFAFADYSRKPRFRIPTPRQFAVDSTTSTSDRVCASTDWTYQTVSA